MKKTEVEASALEEQPGYFIRRLQQIAVAVFLEETQTHAITPVQYAALGGCRAWGSARAGGSFGASLGAGEACGWTTQRVGNDDWHRKSPRPYGLTLKWG